MVRSGLDDYMCLSGWKRFFPRSTDSGHFQVIEKEQPYTRPNTPVLFNSRKALSSFLSKHIFKLAVSECPSRGNRHGVKDSCLLHGIEFSTESREVEDFFLLLSPPPFFQVENFHHETLGSPLDFIFFFLYFEKKFLVGLITSMHIPFNVHVQTDNVLLRLGQP